MYLNVSKGSGSSRIYSFNRPEIECGFRHSEKVILLPIWMNQIPDLYERGTHAKTYQHHT